MKNFQKILKEYGISQKELAQKIGIKEYSLSRYNKGTNLPNAKILIKIADYLNVSVDYLLDREEKSFSSIEKREIKDTLKSIEHKIDSYSPQDAVPVPLLEDKIAAGVPVSISDSSSEYRWFLASWLRRFARPFLVQVGENQLSMFPFIRPGDLLLVDRRPVLKPEKDEIYVVNTDEGGTIKRCTLSSAGLHLISDNPDHLNRVIDVRGTDIRKIIVGHVVWIGRELVNQKN
jgi:transcriptional regulator with XRE-family HTH domain